MHKKNRARRSVLLAVSLMFSPMACLAEPLVTITCDAPKGTAEDYGVSGAERTKAAIEHKPQPADHLSGPYPDAFNLKPTFIVDSSRRKLTLVWGTEPAREIPIVSYTPEFFSALEAHPGRNGAAILYSFYPKLGEMFQSQHYLDVVGADASQYMFSAKCNFTWSGKP